MNQRVIKFILDFFPSVKLNGHNKNKGIDYNRPNNEFAD